MKKFCLIFLASILSFAVCGKEGIKEINLYLNNINEFYSSFLQVENDDIREGKFYLKNNRIRIEYSSPSNIVFVLKKKQSYVFQ